VVVVVVVVVEVDVVPSVVNTGSGFPAALNEFFCVFSVTRFCTVESKALLFPLLSVESITLLKPSIISHIER